MSATGSSRARRGVAAMGGGLSADFWRLWGSAAFANLADGILFIAIQIIAVRLGASPAEITAITFASRVPMLALGLIAGGLADRMDRRRTMLAIQLLRAVVAGTLVVAAATGSLSLIGLAVAAAVLGVGEAFFDTNALSLLPMVAGRERLVAANGRLFAVETVMGTFVGPPLGAFLVAISVPLALTSAATGFALAAVGLALLRGSFRPVGSAAPRGLLSEIAEGIRFLGGHRLLLTLTAMTAFVHLGSSAVWALQALYALAPGPMGLSEPEFGLLIVAQGAGSLVGSFVTGALVGRLGRSRVLVLAVVVFALGFGIPALSANAVLVGIGYFAAGVALMAFFITNASTRQAVLPPELMGRVHATYRTIAYLAGIVGAVVAAAIGELIGLREAFAVGALLILLGAFGGFVATDRRIADAESVAEAGVRSGA